VAVNRSATAPVTCEETAVYPSADQVHRQWRSSENDRSGRIHTNCPTMT